MADDEDHGERDDRQAGLHPIGRALRTTYDAENHDSLGSDLTGLMLELARVGDEPAVAARPVVPTPTASQSPAMVLWLRRLFRRFPA